MNSEETQDLPEFSRSSPLTLGIELELKATCMLLDNLKLDVVAAYLMAGDATGDEDPIELGAQLSFSF